MKSSWLRFVGFLILFYLIIWGAMKLMISTVGGSRSSRTDKQVVYVLNTGSQSRTLTDDWSPQLTYNTHNRLEVLLLNDFMEQTINRDAVIVVASEWSEKGVNAPAPFVGQLTRWADSGALVLVYGYWPEYRSENGIPSSVRVDEGYYSVKLTLSGDSTVLWMEDQVIPVVCRTDAEVLATANVDGKPVPVIWKEKRNKGILLFCIPNLPVSPGAENLLDQLIVGNDTLVAHEYPSVKPGIIGEEVFRDQMQMLMSDNPGKQLSAINWFLETQHPVAREVLLPFLYSEHSHVVVAAAEALVSFHALSSIPFLRSAANVQPDELKPVLLKAAERISTAFDRQYSDEVMDGSARRY